MDKLSKEDKDILLSWGYSKENLNQIEYAINHTIYTYYDECNNSTKISYKKARKILGNKVFLSGIGRSAFHRSCTRNQSDNLKCYIEFDSSNVFKR